MRACISVAVGRMRMIFMQCRSKAVQHLIRLTKFIGYIFYKVNLMSHLPLKGKVRAQSMPSYFHLSISEYHSLSQPYSRRNCGNRAIYFVAAAMLFWGHRGYNILKKRKEYRI